MSMAEPLEDGLDDLGILNILDFQLDNEDEEGIEDWDASKSQCLGPIPSDLIMGPPAVPRCAVKTQPPRFMPGTVSSIYGTPMQQQSNYVQEASSSHIRRHSKYAEFQEPGIFQMQSPVSVLESNGSSSSGKRIPIRSDIVIPRRTRSKRVRSSEPNRWREVLAASTFKRTSGAKNYMGRRKRLSPMETVKVHKEAAPGDVKKCSHCQITSTPQWREGPMGRQTLCNACGVRYRSGRLYPEYRPAASPTFVPSLHSNSHRKVIELRNKAETQPQPQPQVTRVEGQPQPHPQVTRVEGLPQPHPHPQVTRVERWPQPQVTRVERWPQVTSVESWLQPQVTRVESQPQAQVTRVESWPQPQVTRVERQPQPQPHPQVTRVERQPQPQVTRVERQPQPQPQVTRVEILRIEAVPAMSPQMELVPMSSQFFD